MKIKIYGSYNIYDRSTDHLLLVGKHWSNVSSIWVIILELQQSWNWIYLFINWLSQRENFSMCLLHLSNNIALTGKYDKLN